MSKKPGIPSLPPGDFARRRFDEAIRENIEAITGQRGGLIAPLESNATTAQIIDKINEIIARLQ